MANSIVRLLPISAAPVFPIPADDQSIIVTLTLGDTDTVSIAA
ncbi:MULTISPECIES: hypothetical protein [Bifidobacterium]|nr:MULTISPECIES: hypothetical protein [Bifidobacterium]